MAAPPRHSRQYGRPVAGSRTEARGRYAGAHISQEVKDLCRVISQMGEEQPDGTVSVSFGRLFETIYQNIEQSCWNVAPGAETELGSL